MFKCRNHNHPNPDQSANPPSGHQYDSNALAAINENLKSLAEEYKKNNKTSSDNGRKNFRLELAVAFGIGLYTLITAGLLIAGLYQNKTSSEQLRVAQDTEKRQLRAYLGIMSIQLQCPDCDSISYRERQIGKGIAETKDIIIFDVKASGVTPAYNVHLYANWQPIPSVVPYVVNIPFPEFPSTVSIVESRPTILPNEHAPFFVAINIEIFQNARLGKIHLRVYGHVDYDDVFGAGWQAEFCYVYQPSIGGGDMFTTCPEHNGDHARR